MDKEKEIEEMAVIGCKRNPQAYTAEECAKCSFKQGSCNAHSHAEALYNAGYRRAIKLDKVTAKYVAQEFCYEIEQCGLDYGDLMRTLERLGKKYGVETENDR